MHILYNFRLSTAREPISILTSSLVNWYSFWSFSCSTLKDLNDEILSAHCLCLNTTWNRGGTQSVPVRAHAHNSNAIRNRPMNEKPIILLVVKLALIILSSNEFLNWERRWWIDKALQNTAGNCEIIIYARQRWRTKLDFSLTSLNLGN